MFILPNLLSINSNITKKAIIYLIDKLKEIDGNPRIQRYKGLGEMNPEQLWETTMNPGNRVLKRIELEDNIEAETMFTVLMGGKVEPRKDFIYRHSLEVKELDI
jgi:DNA gyrase subunit B